MKPIGQLIDECNARAEGAKPARPTTKARTAQADPRPAKPTKDIPKREPAPAQVIERKPNTAEATQRERKLLESATVIAGERPGDDDKGYMHSILCQVGLPRSKFDGKRFERKSGGAGLLIESGSLWNGKDFIEQPIPYGPMPRLVLAYVNTHAVRFNTPEIPLGDSASEFLRMIGKEPNGGVRSSFATFRKQIQALAACRITLGYTFNGKAETFKGEPIERFSAWMDDEESQRNLWPASLKLSDAYYNTLKGHAVPIDMRAITALKGSALALDVYTWLAHRLHRIEGGPKVLYWASLREQFGQEYQGKEADKDFKKKFIPALNAVLAVYPLARVKRVTRGMMLMASPPPVPFSG